MIGRLAGLAWNAAAIWFLLSVVSASLIGLVRKARARGKRKFATEPTARVRALKSNTSHAHIYDGA